MTWIDGTIIILFLLFITGIGLYFSKRASKNTSEFILAGRKLPWWLAGTSMLASGFNADTPLHTTRKIHETGLSGAWFYWSASIGGVLKAVFWNRLWRRTEITTPLEYFDIRYAAGPAKALRTVSALSAIFFNSGVIVSISLIAMQKLAAVLLGLPETVTWFGLSLPSDLLVTFGAVVLALIYSAAAGVYSVVWTDLLEFGVALLGTYVLFILVSMEVGPPSVVWEKLGGMDETGREATSFLPGLGPTLMVFFLLRPLLEAFTWLAATQRILATSDERQACLASLWSVFTTQALRGWPWYLCGLAAILLISGQDLIAQGFVQADGSPDFEMIFPSLILEFMPTGLLGLMVAGMLSAFMSTMDTQLHLNASIFVNDLYRPLVNPGRSERHYVWTARWTMGAVTVIGIGSALLFDDILQLLAFFITFGSSQGVIRIMSWLWWRVTAKAELISIAFGALIVSFLVLVPAGRNCIDAVLATFGWEGWDVRFSVRFLMVTLSTGLVALASTLLTKPEDEAKLSSFYRKACPYGAWGPMARKNPDIRNKDSLIEVAGAWALGSGVVFAGVFTVGLLLFGKFGWAALTFAIFAVSARFLLRWVNRVCAAEERTASGT